MRLAIRSLVRVLVVATCTVLFIAGGLSPRHASTTSDRGATARAATVEPISQQSALAQTTADDEQTTAEQEGRDDTPVTGAAADRAAQAAQAAVPGATVRQVEREANDDDSPRSAYEVELVKPNGSTVEVDLDASYKLLATEPDNSRDD